MMQQIRQPAVAGTFYPAEPGPLRAMVQDYLAAVQSPNVPAKAIIAPHAGYIYSGSIAASAYASWTTLSHQIQRIVVLGPSHRLPFEGLALSSDEYFMTPLGRIALDQEAQQQLMGLAQVTVLDAAHQMEHSLEVQLPFLQVILDSFRIVPIVVGKANPVEVAQVLEYLWYGPDTRIVVSSDLSHYLDYASACRRDQATSEAIKAFRLEDIGYDDACGRNPINGLLHLGRQRGLQTNILDLRNSGDTAGSKDQVVGYGAYSFQETSYAS